MTEVWDIRIRTGSGVAVFQQIVDQVRLGVVQGSLATGAQLPSVRTLSENLGINPNTVAKAYAELSRQGFVETQPGRGIFVAPSRAVMARSERQRRLEEAARRFATEGLGLHYQAEDLHRALDTAFDQIRSTQITSEQS
jgi:GntR family transcriptional regulator